MADVMPFRPLLDVREEAERQGGVLTIVLPKQKAG